MAAIHTEQFKLADALSGAPFIHKFDIARRNASEFVSTSIRFIDDPQHPCWIAFCAEWLVYESEDEMQAELLLVVTPEAHR